MASKELLPSINREAAELVQKLGIEDRVEEYSPAPAYVTIKDHKPD